MSDDLITANLEQHQILVDIQREFLDANPESLNEVLGAFIRDYKNNNKWSDVSKIVIKIID